MKTTFQKLSGMGKRIQVKGFILPFTMLISVLILIVTGSVMTLLTKQLYFSKVYRQSQTAYYAADDAIACAIEIDDSFVGSDGLGIFPSDPVPSSEASVYYTQSVLAYVNTKRADASPPLPTIPTINDITCAQSPIFNPSTSNFAVSPTNYKYNSVSAGIEEGKTSTYTMKMPLSDGTYRCAKVTINKTPSFRQVIAQGYSKIVQATDSCANPNGSVERAVVNTTLAEE